MLCCGHVLHLKCYVDYVDSLLERQNSNQRYEGSYKVNPSCGEFFCPTCRRICNVIVPVPIINHKRQHVGKTIRWGCQIYDG